MQYKSKKFRDNIFVHIHECLVSRQAVFLNIKLISIHEDPHDQKYATFAG